MVSRSTGSDTGLAPADRLLLIVTAAATAAWCLASARVLGATFDEPFYLEAGLDAWRRGHFKELLAAGTMPLPAHLQTLPLYAIEAVTGRPWVVASDIGAMLPVARSVTLVFWCVLLIYGMRLAHAVGGPWVGRLALMLIALDPSFLAHASLATSDVALAGSLMAFAYAWRAGRDGRWTRRVGLPAAAFAVALASKASALSFGPMVFAAIAIDDWRRGRRLSVRDAAQVFLIGTAVAVVYCGSGGEPSFQGILSRMPADHVLRPALAWFGGLPLSPNAFYALWFQADHNNIGQPTYLIGHESARSLWFYVPVLPLIKLPLPTLLLILLALVVPKPRLKAILTLSTIILMLMLLIRVQTGIRFLLPLLSFLMIAVALRIVPAIDGLSPARRRRAGAGVAVLLAWLAVGDARAWPDALRYTNEIWGGPSAGYKVVSDSNYDWGQGLPELAVWRQEHGEAMIVWYFGTDPRFPELQRYDPRRDTLDASGERARYLAVSTSLLYGGYLTASGPGRELMLRLRERQPAARTRTFLIFDAAPLYNAGPAAVR
ncbi:MAG: hypothetical protein WC815_07745 [Vicinamibacterales bacterium]|jgi:hypothetical protein